MIRRVRNKTCPNCGKSNLKVISWHHQRGLCKPGTAAASATPQRSDNGGPTVVLLDGREVSYESMPFGTVYRRTVNDMPEKKQYSQRQIEQMYPMVDLEDVDENLPVTWNGITYWLTALQVNRVPQPHADLYRHSKRETRKALAGVVRTQLGTAHVVGVGTPREEQWT